MFENKILDTVMKENPANPTQFVRSIVKDYSKEKLCKQIDLCKDCEICEGGFKSVPHGNTNATIMFIGGAPEPVSKESTRNALFDKSSADIIDTTLFDILHLKKDELFFANVINCAPYKIVSEEKIHRAPTTKELKNCILFIKNLIEIVQPLVIVLLGATSLSAFDNKKSLIKSRGEWFSINGIPAIASHDPQYFKKMQGKKDEETLISQQYEFIDDIKKAVDFIKKEYPNIIIESNERN